MLALGAAPGEGCGERGCRKRERTAARCRAWINKAEGSRGRFYFTSEGTP